MKSKKRPGLYRRPGKPASKKGRHVETCDRISTLPDHILCHILSFLPTKYAVRTSVLSKRWIDIFISVPVLDFNDSNISPPSRLTNIIFSNFVSRVLKLNKVKQIPRFRIKCVKYRYNYQDVCSWIFAAISRNVKELNIATRLMSSGPLPQEILDYKMLVVLKMHAEFVMHLSGSVCLPFLKTLHLINVTLSTKDSAWKTFLNFPLLEILVLKCISANNKIIDISIPSLKRLELIKLRGFSHIVLNAPALHHFIYKSSAFDSCINSHVGYSGSGFDSLINAHVGIESESGFLYNPSPRPEISHEFSIFVNMLQHVHSLSLTEHTLKAMLDSDCSLPTFHNLIRLEFIDAIESGWQPISDLLDSAPNLQFLTFGDDLPLILEHDDQSESEFNSDDEEKILVPIAKGLSYIFPHDDQSESDSDDEEKTMDNQSESGSDVEEEITVPIAEHLCLALHMTEVKIKKFSGHGDGIAICRYFLKKAKFLEKLIIHSVGEIETHFETSQKLLAFPRSSTTCQIVFIPEYELH